MPRRGGRASAQNSFVAVFNQRVKMRSTQRNTEGESAMANLTRTRQTRRARRAFWHNVAGAALIVLSLAALAGMFYLAAAHDCALDPAPYPAAVLCEIGQ